ncbi:hypothetical protein F4680DRAFT_195771 [Xylaria scruposa]|nr:hypothetical protein F4680DRAFT_195771 [Xylaria scruposa]
MCQSSVMDPITAVSLVSSIISFVTFGKDLVKGAIKVHESQDGHLKENQNREFVAGEMRRFVTVLQPPDESKLAGWEKGLVCLAAKCHKLAEDMAKVLDKIKAKDPNSRAQSVWAALKAKVNERDLMDFERQLDQCVTQLHLQLTFFTSRHMTATLNDLVDSAGRDASALERLKINVDQLRQSVDSMNKESAEQVCQVMQLQGKAVDTAIQHKILNSLSFERMTERFEMVEKAHLDTFRWLFDGSAFVYDAPLESLSLLFSESVLNDGSDEYNNSDWDLEDEDDDEEIKDENDKDNKNESEVNKGKEEDEDDTDGDDEDEEEDEYGENEKAFPSRMVPSGLTRRSIKAKISAGRMFINWLSSSDGIFHISGKMGSGKSTMMKLLYEHPATKYELEKWAGSQVLVLANFFFWKPGSNLQKSLTGLLRALLHATLKTFPELIPVVMPEHWKQMQAQKWQNQSAIQISNEDIRDSLVRLIRNPYIHSKYRFCFFIDGLDEYEGTIQEDQRYMVDFLLKWTKASRGKLKICVSSREHNIFMNAFQAEKRIRLHEFTKHDMELYVHGKLNHIPKAKTKEFLVREIPSRAHGIFLWVALVVKTLREQLEDDATEDELKTSLCSIPEELDDLFKHLFTSISKVNSRRACQVFTLLLTGRKYDIRLYLYGLSFLEEYEKNNRFAFLEEYDITKRYDCLYEYEKNTFTASQEAFTDRRKSHREAMAKTARTRKQLNTWCKGLVEVVETAEDHSGCQEWDLRHQVDFTHRSIYDFLESHTTTIDADWQSTMGGFDAVDALSQITWATHKPTLTTCSQLFPIRKIISMRLENDVDKAPFEYLERLANGERSHMEQSYHTINDFVVEVVSVVCRGCTHMRVASRRFLSSQEPEIRNNSADAINCSFGILLLAVSEGHYGYLNWKIDNDPSSVDNPHKIALLVCTLLKFRIDRLPHPPASSPIAFLFKKKLISPESMSFWAPVHLTPYLFSTSRELINLELSIWHWYLFYITSSCIGSLFEIGLQRRTPPHSPITFRRFARIPVQRRSQIGEALEAFLDHEADPYFVLSVSGTEDEKGGKTAYHLQLDFEFGRKRERISIGTTGWTTEKPSSFGRFSLKKSLKLTFREWIENFELPNQYRLISLLERNERLEEEKLARGSRGADQS